MGDISFVLLVFLSLVMLIYSVQYFSNKYEINPELSRKLVHMSIGLVTLLFPIIFEFKVSILYLFFLSALFFYMIRYKKKFKVYFGHALHGIERQSYGEFFFSLGIMLTFLLTEDIKIYFASILVLTFSDTFANLIGIKYASYRINFFSKISSVEGSLIFFISAFLILHLLGNTFFMSLNSALILTLIEMISIKGLDNLLLPVSTFLLLKYFTENIYIVLFSILLFIIILYITFKKYNIKESEVML